MPALMRASSLLILIGLALMPSSSRAAPDAPIRLYAAGSLTAALTEAARAFESSEHVPVTTIFGPSGVLRGRLESGEKGDLFASADRDNPLALQRAGKSGPVVLLVRNRLCAYARPGLAFSSATLLDTLLDPSVKLGTSTPLSDPSGDYAWQVFAKADRVRPGSRALLEAKAIKLVGAADSPVPPAGSSAYAWHVREGRADLFLAYCTAAKAAEAELPGARTVELPQNLATGAEYGLTVLNGAADTASRLALFLLSADGQRILARYGFDAPALPSDGL
jgi:molybdenum ABC transporter molybdate-binding protein